MTDVSQIYRSRTYKILESKFDMKGKTTIGVIQLASDVTAFVNTGTILVLDNGNVLKTSDLLDSHLTILEEETGIKKDQLI